MKNKELYVSKEVIVRAYADKPVRLYLLNVGNSHCYVGNKDSGAEIGVPHNQVFAYSPELFRKLTEAYRKQDLHSLDLIYSSIPVEDFACNRYQNKVPCIHGQEAISDTEGTAVSDSR
jgi:hypothetical protein